MQSPQLKEYSIHEQRMQLRKGYWQAFLKVSNPVSYSSLTPYGHDVSANHDRLAMISLD